MNEEQLDVEAILKRIDRLGRELSICKAENARLREQVAFFTNHPSLTAGIKGETIIAQLLNRARTTGNASYDIEGNVRLEVKYSRLTDNGKGVLRWTWGAVFGGGGNKEYDRLILLGDTNHAHSLSYLDSASPYILFDVSYNEVSQLITNGGTARDQIRLSSNPKKANSRCKILWLSANFAEVVIFRTHIE